MTKIELYTLEPFEIDLVNRFWEEFFNPKRLARYEDFDPTRRQDFNLAGLQGEAAVCRWSRQDLTHFLENHPVFGSDEGWDITINGVKFDIKTQVTSYVPPKDFYYNISAKIVDKPEVEAYLWVVKSPHDDRRYYLVGWLFRDEFKDKATFHPEGEIMRGQSKPYTMDTYDVPESYLRDLSFLRQSFI